MKTYYWTPDDMELDSGSHGEWVKTADHFETVWELQEQLKAERAKSAALLLRFETTLTQLSSVMENARKGVDGVKVTV